jgi:hypothetical protein
MKYRHNINGRDQRQDDESAFALRQRADALQSDLKKYAVAQERQQLIERNKSKIKSKKNKNKKTNK